MATYLEHDSREPGSSSVDSVATDMCGSIGNLLGAASDAAAVRQPNMTNRTSQEQSKARDGIQEKRAKVSHKRKFKTLRRLLQQKRHFKRKLGVD